MKIILILIALWIALLAYGRMLPGQAVSQSFILLSGMAYGISHILLYPALMRVRRIHMFLIGMQSFLFAMFLTDGFIRFIGIPITHDWFTLASGQSHTYLFDWRDIRTWYAVFRTSVIWGIAFTFSLIVGQRLQPKGK